MYVFGVSQAILKPIQENQRLISGKSWAYPRHISGYLNHVRRLAKKSLGISQEYLRHNPIIPQPYPRHISEPLWKISGIFIRDIFQTSMHIYRHYYGMAWCLADLDHLILHIYIRGIINHKKHISWHISHPLNFHQLRHEKSWIPSSDRFLGVRNFLKIAWFAIT